jgi:hypothetical protein
MFGLGICFDLTYGITLIIKDMNVSLGLAKYSDVENNGSLMHSTE